MKKKVIIIYALLISLLSIGCSGKSSDYVKQEMEQEVTENTHSDNSKDSGDLLGNSFTVDVAYADTDLVKVKDFISDIYVDLKYAGENNFTGKPIYDFSEVYLRYGTVKKLITVQNELRDMGLSLIIWDGYRPKEAQFKLWETVPDSKYVSNPNIGFSKHSNGSTLDVSIVTCDGTAVEMPSEFDEFSTLADRDYSEVWEEAAKNAMLLERLMTENGFNGYFGEWWHFNDNDEYGYDDIQPLAVYNGREAEVVNCNEFISLRESPEYNGDVVEKIPLGEKVVILGGSYGDFLRVEYKGCIGFASGEYLALR